MININLPAKYRHIIDISSVERVSTLVLQILSTKEMIVSISFTNNTFIQRLNKKYRKIDEPTDVLSFTMREKFPEDKMTLLGDIVISVEQAINQAKVNKTSLEDEISLLLIHGILHLFSYDHDTNKNKEKMWKIQDNLLKQSGIPIRLPRT
jgi:probable rRNA maturation factor